MARVNRRRKNNNRNRVRERIRINYGNTEPAVVSEFIEHLDMVLEQEPDIPIVLYARESTPSQKANGNLEDQVDDLICSLKKRKANITEHIFEEVINGSIINRQGKLFNACKKAREIKGILVAVSTDRLIRPDGFNSKKKQFPPLTIEEMELFAKKTCGTRIATIEDPNITKKKTYAVHTKRGMQRKGKMGGRPKKPKPGDIKKRRKEKLAQVLAMKHMSCREIAKKLGIPYRTICDWKNRY